MPWLPFIRNTHRIYFFSGTIDDSYHVHKQRGWSTGSMGRLFGGNPGESLYGDHIGLHSSQVISYGNVINKF